MDQFPQALAHGDITEVFSDIFFVTGAMETVLQEMDWEFSRNMTVIRDGERLILINSVRLGEQGLAELDRLGRVTDVIRLGCLHGRDDAFYVDRYNAEYWVMPGMEEGDNSARLLSSDQLPITDASLFSFDTTAIPEGILHINRDGGVLVACDALQNWLKPDEYFSDASKALMESMNFFTPANVGPVWAQVATPSGADFSRLSQLTFKHALCGHGEPLRDTAFNDFSGTFQRIFAV